MEDEAIISRWENRVKPLVFADVTTSHNPVTVFLGGQPGAGKTQATKIAQQQFGDKYLVSIVGDDFRRFHPDFKYLMETDPLRMPDVTARAVDTSHCPRRDDKESCKQGAPDSHP
ncbi:MAG: zeta toxin family protein [Mobiluncus sp.]|uniref:zeta toxin family protein n=1 Tax=Mobiluncus sp. TaxID=47293 RepID=UPI002584B8DE|nr:zeta toxin family protein [Mobiluncus sp.]MCI6583640.1 zeta toxin family protein [Mobiluncus sp.]